MKTAGAWGILLALMACGGRSPSVVARAGQQTLTNQRLSELMVLAQPVPLTTDVAYQLASFWVTYAAFAQRAATGDSLLDSTTVLRLMAHRARQEVVTAWRRRLLARLPRAQAAGFDSSYARALVEARHAELTAGALERVRNIAIDPWHVPDSASALATFTGGALTAGELQQELQYLPPATRGDIRAADDARIAGFLWGMLVDRLMWLQADSAGVRLNAAAYREMRKTCEDAVHRLRERLGASPASVEQYLDAAVARRVPLEPVPPFLAVFLLRETDWDIAAARMDGVVERARRLIAAAGHSQTP